MKFLKAGYCESGQSVVFTFDTQNGGTVEVLIPVSKVVSLCPFDHTDCGVPNHSGAAHTARAREYLEELKSCGPTDWKPEKPKQT